MLATALLLAAATGAIAPAPGPGAPAAAGESPPAANASAAPASPPKRPRYLLQVSMRLGLTYVLGAPLPNAMSDQRFGTGGALRLVLRNPYFLSPFVEGGYTFLSKGSARVPAGEPGGPGVISDSLDAFHVGAGVAFDLWRLRFSAGAAAYFFGLTTSFAGVTSSTRDASIGSILAVAGTLLRAPRFYLSANFAAHNAPEAGLNWFLFGFSVHGDVLRW